MKIEQNTAMVFPKEPPKPIGKPVKGEPLHKNSLWFSHDPAIYKDPVSKKYYVYSTEALAKRSEDLITWENIGKIVAEPPKESYEHVGGKAIWAPDIVKVGDEYRLYCSNSTFGVRTSCIFLATADNPEGPFIPKGCVIKTSEKEDSPVNAIDANIVEDVDTGEQYMVYGSFWGGCNILKLNKETGYPAEEGYGKCIARRPKLHSGAIEGPYIRYNQETGYYYLFVSYGSLNSDYNIRVGRSKCITGPYLDVNGCDMIAEEDEENKVGLMIACGYHFDDSQGYMGPGHNSVLRDDDGRWYLVCHIREHNFNMPQISTMHIYQIFWTDDGWPVISPEVYAGEKLQKVDEKLLYGKYERIKLVHNTPQGVLNSFPMIICENGKVIMSLTEGTWELLDDNTMKLIFGKTEETVKIAPAWDWQKNEPTLVFTGKDNNGICVFGKKV